MWIVRAEFDHGRGYSEAVNFGVFPSEREAVEWMNGYPGDEDMLDMNVEFINTHTLPNGEPNH